MPTADATLPHVALAAGVTAALLQLSAALYASGVPYSAIHPALAACALGCWAAFDGSLQVFNNDIVVVRCASKGA